ncbi:MAG: PAS domain S-box protein [Pedobacter sp.]
MIKNLNNMPSQLLLAGVLEATNTGVVITDNLLPDNPIIYCNPAFEELSGYPRAEIIGHNCRFLQGKDRGQEERRQIRDAIAGGRSCVVELRNYTKEGRLFYNELYLSPVKDGQGKITHFVGIQNDVTARKKAELALEFNRAETEQRVRDRTRMLKESEEYLSSIIETIRESLVVLDKDYVILDVNNCVLPRNWTD